MLPTVSCLIQTAPVDSVKNSMLKNGLTPVGEETTETDSKEDKGFFEDVKEKASNMVDDAKKSNRRGRYPRKSEKRLGYFQRLAWFTNQKNDSEEFLNRFLQIEDKDILATSLR